MRSRRLAGDDLPAELLIFHAAVGGLSYETWLAARAEWARTRDWMVWPVVPFAAPEGDMHAVWAAFEDWDADLTVWQLMHPEHKAQVAAVRELSVTPDEPWDASDV